MTLPPTIYIHTGISHWTGLYELALTDRNIQVHKILFENGFGIFDIHTWFSKSAGLKNLDDFEVLSNDLSSLRTSSASFLSETVEASQYYFFENQVCLSKISNLRIHRLLSNKILLAYFYLSEPIHKVQFNVRYVPCT